MCQELRWRYTRTYKTADKINKETNGSNKAKHLYCRVEAAAIPTTNLDSPYK